MKTIRYLAIALAIMIPLSNISTAQAAERSVKEMLEECFWGLLFEDEDKRQLSLVLNIVSGALGSYAVTSGTLSADSLCASKKVASLQFITESYASLLDETVKGSGEHLTVALNMSGCDAASHPAAIASLRGKMPAILQASPTNELSVEGVGSYYQGLQAAAVESCAV